MPNTLGLQGRSIPIRVRLTLTVTVLVATFALAACSGVGPVGDPQPNQATQQNDQAREWFLVEGESAQVLRLEADGTGVTYEAMLGALRGELPGMGKPRAFHYSATDDTIRLDFEDEPDVTLNVDSSGRTLVIEDATADGWVGTWRDDFE